MERKRIRKNEHHQCSDGLAVQKYLNLEVRFCGHEAEKFVAAIKARMNARAQSVNVRSGAIAEAGHGEVDVIFGNPIRYAVAIGCDWPKAVTCVK